MSTNKCSIPDHNLKRLGHVTQKKWGDRVQKTPKKKHAGTDHVDVTDEEVAMCSNSTKGTKLDSSL